MVPNDDSYCILHPHVIVTQGLALLFMDEQRREYDSRSIRILFREFHAKKVFHSTDDDIPYFPHVNISKITRILILSSIYLRRLVYFPAKNIKCHCCFDERLHADLWDFIVITINLNVIDGIQ